MYVGRLVDGFGLLDKMENIDNTGNKNQSIGPVRIESVHILDGPFENDAIMPEKKQFGQRKRKLSIDSTESLHEVFVL